MYVCTHSRFRGDDGPGRKRGPALSVMVCLAVIGTSGCSRTIKTCRSNGQPKESIDLLFVFLLACLAQNPCVGRAAKKINPLPPPPKFEVPYVSSYREDGRMGRAVRVLSLSLSIPICPMRGLESSSIESSEVLKTIQNKFDLLRFATVSFRLSVNGRAKRRTSIHAHKPRR